MNAEIECKRFQETTPLPEGQLLGKLHQATPSGQTLDVWVLAATRSIPDQIRRALTQAGEDRGVLVAFLDAPAEGLGLLSVLLAEFERVVRGNSSRWPGAAKITRYLKGLRRLPNYETARSELRRTFDHRTLGYVTIRQALNQELERSLTQKVQSRALFGQDITLLQPEVINVDRPKVHGRIDAWWNSWPRGGAILCVHGLEGTGKTWAVGSWLQRRFLASSESGPLIIWCGHHKFDHSALVDLIGRLLAASQADFGEDFIRRRVRNWASGRSATPAILLIVDGLNERGSRNAWRSWLTQARADLETFLPGVAVVLTARTGFWRDLASSLVVEDDSRLVLPVSQLPSAVTSPTQPAADTQQGEVEVLDFSDEELDGGLRSAGHQAWDVSPELRELMRRPKFFARALRLRARIEATGDATVERLLWEDFRDREQERVQVSLSDNEFQAFLLRLAHEWRGRAISQSEPFPSLSTAELSEALQPISDVKHALDDLESTGVIQPQPGGPGYFTLHPQRLAHAFGLLLVRRVAEVGSRGSEAMTDAVEREVEELGDSECGSEAIAFAVCIALASRGKHALPDPARLALLSALAKQRNGAVAWSRSKPWAFFPLQPSIFLQLAETVWASEVTDHTARERIGYCFAWIAETWTTNAELVAACERWLGPVHPAGFEFMSRVEDGEVPNPAIEGRLRSLDGWRGCMTPPLQISLAARQEHLDLAHLALFIVSHARDATYAPALVDWAVSRAIMGTAVGVSEVTWVARFAADALLLKLTDAARELAKVSNEVPRISAATLLRIEGAPASLSLADALQPQAQSLPQTRNLSAVHEAERLAHEALDPSRVLKFSRTRDALAEIDPGEIFKGFAQTREMGDLEDMLPTLCRSSPDSIARFYRRGARLWIGGVLTDPDRQNHAPESVFLLLQDADLRSLRTLRRKLEKLRPAQPKLVDVEWDVTGLILAGTASAQQQLKLLLSRSDNDDNRDWLSLLTPFSMHETRDAIAALPSHSGPALRRFVAFPWKGRIPLTHEQRETIWEAMRTKDLGIFSATPALEIEDPELLRRTARGGLFDDDLLTRILSSRPSVRAVLAEAGLDERISLAARSWLLLQRQLPGDAVRKWVRDVDTMLSRAVGKTVLEPPSVVAHEVVARGLDLEPVTVSGWITSLTSFDGKGHTLADLHFGLVEALVLALLDRNDDRALKVVEALETPNRYFVQYPQITISLPYRARQTAATRSLLLHFLEKSLTDDALQRLVHAATQYSKLEWLFSVAASTHADVRRFERARTFALYGLGPASEDRDAALVRASEQEESWLASLIRWSRRQMAYDAWARHWFRRFLSTPKRSEAWAAFQLFLRCADRRCALWVHDELRSMEDSADYFMRHRHFQLNISDLNRRLKRLNEDRKTRLFGSPIPRADLKPWKETWFLQ